MEAQAQLWVLQYNPGQASFIRSRAVDENLFLVARGRRLELIPFSKKSLF
jgi:hypothetical protein